MKIRELFKTDVVSAMSTETLMDAARRMEWMNISALPVLEADRLVGIITERDVTRAAAAGADMRRTSVIDYMTARPFTAYPEEEAGEVARRMLDLGVRHLPVVQEGKVVGIISARDLLVLEAWEAEVPGRSLV
jgi:CBS domain-containing protein